MGMKYIPFTKSAPFVAVIRLQGAISNSGRGLDDPGLAPVIEKAFSKGKPAAVALEINCPGGSPVQSSLIASRIRRLADERKSPFFAFVEDVASLWRLLAGLRRGRDFHRRMFDHRVHRRDQRGFRRA